MAVVNTGAKSSSGSGTSTVNTVRPSIGGGGGSGSNGGEAASSGSMTDGNLIKALSVISGNYADMLTETDVGNYLHNPAFANDAEGWTASSNEEGNATAYVARSDNKDRLFIKDGSVTQENSRIKKPGKHCIYEYNEKDKTPPIPETSLSGTVSVGSLPGSYSVTMKSITWVTIPETEKLEEKKETGDVLRLRFSFVCREAGTLTIGFTGVDASDEKALQPVTVSVEASEEVQTVEAEGTWDGHGDFRIAFATGEIEVRSLSLDGQELANYKEEVSSYIEQAKDNTDALFMPTTGVGLPPSDVNTIGSVVVVPAGISCAKNAYSPPKYGLPKFGRLRKANCTSVAVTVTEILCNATG